MQQAAIYLRVSTHDQDIASQRHKVLKFAKENNIKIIKEFQDIAYSGASSDRPQYQQLKRWVENNGGKLLLSCELSRASRDLYEYSVLRKLCEDSKVELRFLDLPETGNPATDKLLEAVLAGIAEFERTAIRERMARGKRYLLEKGEPIVSRTPYGYQYEKRTGDSPPEVHINEEEAEILRLIFKLYVNEGLSLSEICRELGRRRIKTRRGNRMWQRSTLRNVLTNTASIGELRYYKNKEDEVSISIEPIISKELFEKAQKKLEENKIFNPRNVKNEYLLSKLLRCKLCGGRYSAYTTNGRKYYRCSTRSHLDPDKGFYSCKNRSLRAEPLEERVWEKVVEIYLDPGEYEKRFNESQGILEKSTQELERRKLRLKDKIAGIDVRIDRIMNRFAQELWGLDRVSTYAKKIEEERMDFEDQLVEVEEELAANRQVLGDGNKTYRFFNELLRESYPFVASEITNLPFPRKQEITRRIVKKIIVHPERGHYTIEFALPMEKVEICSDSVHDVSKTCRGNSGNSSKNKTPR